MKKVCKILIYLVVMVCILLGAIKGVFWYIEEQERKLREAELAELSQTPYEGIFCSMYPIGEFKTEDFETYLGVSTFKSSRVFEELEDMSEYLDVALASNFEMTNVYLGLDPYDVVLEEVEGGLSWDELWENNLIAYIEGYEGVEFEIILPYPSLEYWLSLEDEEVRNRLDSYKRLVKMLSEYENVTCYFIGAMEWFIENSANYVSDYEINEVVAFRVLAYTFGSADSPYEVSKGNITYRVNRLLKRIKEEKEEPSLYPDLSKTQIVFFGDSIIGNFPGSISVPGVVGGLTDAETYNYAIGGSSAAYREGFETSFNEVVSNFIEGTSTVSHGDENYSKKRRKELCFVLHYGINDYFENIPIENPENKYDTDTFAGAMREGIRALKEEYPEATIVVVAPHPVYTLVEHDTSQSNYINAVEAVAKEMSVILINNYEEIGWDEDNYTDYLVDMCHPNEEGRMIIGKRIIEALEVE